MRMKRLNKFYVFFLIATFSCIDIQAQQPTGPSIEFQYIQYCYDTILQDSNGECFFKFTNTGKMPLHIMRATASCGCTDVTIPSKPVLPGKTGIIKVSYDTKELGPFRKTIVIISDALNSEKTILMIRGVVIPKKEK